jgi:RNA polymerase sigma factor (sigma-70 family)
MTLFDPAHGPSPSVTPADPAAGGAELPASAADDVRDRALVDRIARGDDVAFEQLVRAHRPRLLRIAERIVDSGRAEDAVQNALFTAYRQFRAGDAAPKSPSAWLSAVTRNAAIDQLRRRGPVDPVAEPASMQHTPSTDAVAESRAELRRVLGDVAALPEAEREALLLRATTGAGHDAIAEHLSVSSGQARQLLHRARCRLREVAAVLLPAWFALRVSQAKAAIGGMASAAPLDTLAGGRATVVALAALTTVGGGGAAVHAVRADHPPRSAALSNSGAGSAGTTNDPRSAGTAPTMGAAAPEAAASRSVRGSRAGAGASRRAGDAAREETADGRLGAEPAAEPSGSGSAHAATGSRGEREAATSVTGSSSGDRSSETSSSSQGPGSHGTSGSAGSDGQANSDHEAVDESGPSGGAARPDTSGAGDRGSGGETSGSDHVATSGSSGSSGSSGDSSTENERSDSDSDEADTDEDSASSAALDDKSGRSTDGE